MPPPQLSVEDPNRRSCFKSSSLAVATMQQAELAKVMLHEFIVGPLPFGPGLRPGETSVFQGTQTSSSGRDTDDQLQLLKEIMEAGELVECPHAAEWDSCV